MNAQHTPGPWKAHKDGAITTDEDEVVIAQLLDADEVVVSPAQFAADANLIAAAPDLLAALETARRFLRAKHFDAGGRDAIAFVIETAIAKATGSTS